MFLKNEWALTPAAPSALHPSLCLGSLVSSWTSRNRYEAFSYSSIASLHLYKYVTMKPHHSTDRLGVLCKLVVILLLFLLHPPLHFLPLHSFFASTEGRSSSGHLINEAAQSPPIRTHSILFIVDYLWSWRDIETGCYGSSIR